MEWNRVFIIVGIYGAFISFMSIPDDMERFLQMFGVDTKDWQVWNYVLLFVCGFLFILGLYAEAERRGKSAGRMTSSSRQDSDSSLWSSIKNRYKSWPEWTRSMFELAALPFVLFGGMLVTFGPFFLFLWLVETILGLEIMPQSW